MERTQGAAFVADARRSSPDSVRDSRYFISPARPASTHSIKAPSSGISSLRIGAIPARSNPASEAASLAACAISSANIIVGFDYPSKQLGAKTPLSLYGREDD